MKTAAVLFTGGKDSVHALHIAHRDGFDIRVLVSVIPHYKYSMIYHQPYFNGLVSQAQSLQIPLETIGVYNQEEELDALRSILRRVRDRYNVNALVTGAVKSQFQYKLFSKISGDLGLVHVAPNWGLEEVSYMLNVLSTGIEFIIISITSMGIPHALLGKVIDMKDLEKLIPLSKKYGFNLSFEGGEAETFVVNAPLFKYRLIAHGRVEILSEYEGYFHIDKLHLLKKQ